jgi:WD40 repeat protein
VSNSEGEIHIYDVNTARKLSAICPSGSSQPILKVDWNVNDCTFLASGSYEGFVFVYKLE